MTRREPHEASRREGRDSHGRRPHSSSRSRPDDPSPRRRRDDRRHESDRSRRAQYGSRAEESAKEEDHDEKRIRKDAAQRNDPLRAEGKSLSDAKNDPPARHERSPRGTKRFSESREAWKPRSFFQHDEHGSAGQGGRHYDRQASDYGRQRDQKEHLGDKHKSEEHSLQQKVEQAQQQNDVDSTWKHDGFFQLEEEEAPLAKRRSAFKEMGMPLEEQESAPTVTELDLRSRKPDQPGLTSAMGEERRNYHTRGFIRPDDRGTRRGFSDRRSAVQRNFYDSRGRFAGRDRFNNPYGERNSMYQSAGDQAEKWKHDLYDQTNRSPTPKTEEEQIAKVEALLAL